VYLASQQDPFSVVKRGSNHRFHLPISAKGIVPGKKVFVKSFQIIKKPNSFRKPVF
jgi:hypothetical protein